MVEHEEEIPLVAAEQGVVVEMAPPTNALSIQVDEAGPSETIASLITETISESM